MSHDTPEKRIDNIEDREKVNIIKVLIQNWYIVLSFVGIVMAWTTLSLKTSANAESILQLSGKVQNDEQIDQTASVQISIQLSQIQTDIQWIKTKMN
jgi:hypothetical protein